VSRLSAEERRRQLVEEASRAFAGHGYEGTSLDAVARAAGVRKQTLLYYFPNKEALFDACVDELGARLSDALERGLEVPGEGWNRVESVIQAIFHLASEWPEFPALARGVGRHRPPAV
jgi:TetR/AcrR family transcriptional regulator